VTPLAQYLGVDQAIASRAEVDEAGRYTGAMEFYSYGPYKADAMRTIAAAQRIDLAASYAYSDSATDLPMLEAVGHAVVVNPDRELLRAAQEHDWPVVHFSRRVRLRDRMPVPARGPTAAVGGMTVTAAAAALIWWWLRQRPVPPPPPPPSWWQRAAGVAARPQPLRWLGLRGLRPPVPAWRPRLRGQRG